MSYFGVSNPSGVRFNNSSSVVRYPTLASFFAVDNRYDMLLFDDSLLFAIVRINTERALLFLRCFDSSVS